MNKKLTSTIMATALFSTSLILASASSDTIEISAANKGKLINQLATRIWDAPRFSNDTRVDNNLRGKSIYTIQINDKSINQSLIDLTDKSTSSRGMLERAIRDYLTKLKVEDIVKLVCIGFRDVEENGNRVILSDSSKRYVELEYKIISGGDTFYLSDLYDGLFLTEEGQKILESSKEARTMYIKKFGDEATDELQDKNVVKIFNTSDEESPTKDITYNVGNKSRTELKPNSKGYYDIEIHIATAFADDADGDHVYNDVIKVSSKNKIELERFIKWIDKSSADVDILAGDDRYATAVKIAKEANLTSLSKNTTTKVNNIVLVNRDSLVDGLSAAPLANFLAGDGNAPILLTKSDELPRATKRYLRELIDTEVNREIVVSIVGGEKAVSDSVRKQLKELGLRVYRYGGKDREETSLVVAEKIGTQNGAFVVGANGEADAMSIAGYAASKNIPIIVSGFKGLSDDAMYMLEEKDVNIIGGENAVSDEVFKNLKSITRSIRRISGNNRHATNAAVISTFYKNNFGNTKSVIVAKDGMADKSEFIDALTAANLASEQNAPIVIGTNGLTNEQINTIVLNAKDADKVYQVGYGISRKAVKIVAESFGLA